MKIKKNRHNKTLLGRFKRLKVVRTRTKFWYAQLCFCTKITKQFRQKSLYRKPLRKHKGLLSYPLGFRGN